MHSWNAGSNGFSKRVSVKREKPRPSTRTTAHTPGSSRSEWKYSRERSRASNESLSIVRLLDPARDLEPARARQAHVVQHVESFGGRGSLQSLHRCIEGDVGDAVRAQAGAVALQ